MEQVKYTHVLMKVNKQKTVHFFMRTMRFTGK